MHNAATRRTKRPAKERPGKEKTESTTPRDTALTSMSVQYCKHSHLATISLPLGDARDANVLVLHIFSKTLHRGDPNFEMGAAFLLNLYKTINVNGQTRGHGHMDHTESMYNKQQKTC